MAVSTISSALGATGGINKESTSVINYLNGGRSAEQMIQEYFGLRKERIYSDDGTEVIDMINEFRDPEILQKKKVCYKQYFADKGLTEEMFYKLVPRNLVYVEKPVVPGVVPEVVPNLTQDDKDTTSVGIVEEKPVVQRPRGRTPKNKK